MIPESLKELPQYERLGKYCLRTVELMSNAKDQAKCYSGKLKDILDNDKDGSISLQDLTASAQIAYDKVRELDWETF